MVEPVREKGNADPKASTKRKIVYSSGQNQGPHRKRPDDFPPHPKRVCKEKRVFFNKSSRDDSRLLCNNVWYEGKEGMAITLDGVEYKTENHALAAKKFEYLSKVVDGPRGEDMLRFSMTFRGNIYDNSFEVSDACKRFRLTPCEYDLMKKAEVSFQKMVCAYKVSQYPEVRRVLRETKDSELVFLVPEATFWSARELPDGSVVGNNMLGKIWMNTREFL